MPSSEDANMLSREQSSSPQMNQGATKGGGLRGIPDLPNRAAGAAKMLMPPSHAAVAARKVPPLVTADAVIVRRTFRPHPLGRYSGRNIWAIGAMDIIERPKIRKNGSFRKLSSDVSL